MASEDAQPGQNRPIGEHGGNLDAQRPTEAQRAGEAPSAPPPPPSPVGTAANPQPDEPSTDATLELPIFGGVNPPLSDWYRNPQAEALNRARHDAEEAAEAAANELANPLTEGLEGLDEEFLNNRRRRQELLSHLFSPFYILPLFILALLLGISTVNISIPESATVRASIGFINYTKLSVSEQVEFQLDQERILKSDAARGMTRGLLSQGPRPVDPSYVTDTLEFHRAVDRKWHPDGRLELTVRSEDPDADVLRLGTMTQAYVLLGRQRIHDIEQYQATVQKLEAAKTAAENHSAELRQQIEELVPLASKQSTLNESVLSTQQYLSRLDESAPERVAAERNLQHLREQVKVAREAGEMRDKLMAQRIDVIQQVNDTIDQIAQKRELAGRVVYPRPMDTGDVTVTDLRPASYRALWVVTVVICAIFALLVFLAYVRNLRRETAALGRATADATRPD